MNITFIEDFDNNALKGIEGQIIALTPMAMYELDRRGYTYKIPEDYFVWQETLIYTEKFRGWLNKLELFLIERYPEIKAFDIPMTVHCVSMLKNVIDAFVRKGMQFKKIIEQEKPDKCYYMIRFDKQDVMDDELYFKGMSIFSRFFGKGFVAEFDRQWLFAKMNVSKEVTDWRDNKGIRGTYDWFRYLQFLPSWKRNERFLFASPMSGLRTFNRLGKITGLVKEKEYNIKLDDFLLDIMDLVNKIDDLGGFDKSVSFVLLRDRIYYFVEKIVLKILCLKDFYIRYLKENKFDAVIFTRRNKLYQYGLLLAARQLYIPTIYVKHGWEAYDNWANDWNRLRLYDYFVTHTKEDKEFFSNRVEENCWNCKVI